MIAFKDTIFAYALYYPAVELLSAMAIALVVWRGGFGVLGHGVTIGVLAMFIQYSQRFWRPIQDLSDKYNILQAAMAACERIFKLLDTPPEIVSPAHPVAATAATDRVPARLVYLSETDRGRRRLWLPAAATPAAMRSRRLSTGLHRVDSEGRELHR
jgi:ABC-type multidrug transport system fused ATPase/permease subunit